MGQNLGYVSHLFLIAYPFTSELINNLTLGARSFYFILLYFILF